MPKEINPKDERQLSKGMRIFSGLTLMLLITGIAVGFIAYFVFFSDR